MTTQESTFREYLASKGLRMTRERRTVLTGVLEIQGHFTADELHLALREKRPRASRATVYRTLDHLVGSGLVDKVDLGGHRAYYENFYGREHHDHLICLHCGAIIEFTNRALEELQDSVCREHQFEAGFHSHKIFGRCEKCRG